MLFRLTDNNLVAPLCDLEYLSYLSLSGGVREEAEEVECSTVLFTLDKMVGGSHESVEREECKHRRTPAVLSHYCRCDCGVE